MVGEVCMYIPLLRFWNLWTWHTEQKRVWRE